MYFFGISIIEHYNQNLKYTFKFSDIAQQATVINRIKNLIKST
jgi:hypothetical protein